mmetsp:Transcript_64089/g.198416  ORF Transcript_64089/g.198416 Transcript_64089/m.198416 type:complete len:312 (+) Transcript_64089:485-1420(+)
MFKRRCSALDAIKHRRLKAVGRNTVPIPVGAQNAGVHSDAVPENHVCGIRVGAPEGVDVVPCVLDVRALNPGMRNRSVQVDAISLERAGNEVADQDVLRALGVARLGHPNGDLARADAVRLAEAALLRPVARRAVVVPFDDRAHLGLVLLEVVVVHSHVRDGDVHGTHPVRAAVVHARDAAVVLRASLGLERAPAAETPVVVWADGIEALITDVAHGHVAAEHESHARRHHVLRVAVVHQIVGHTVGGQKQRLLAPVWRSRRVGLVVRVVGTSSVQRMLPVAEPLFGTISITNGWLLVLQSWCLTGSLHAL